MEFADTAGLQLILVFFAIAGTLALYATEKLPLEVTSLGVICVLLVIFQIFPLTTPDGGNRLDAHTLLSGFASPALIAVLALLILGEGLNRTGALDQVAVMVHAAARGQPTAAVSLALVVVVLTSALLNNIPVVVIFIPILQSLAVKTGRPAAKYMMPLSFAAILGGMTTLIGSSTNLLVSSSLVDLGEAGFDFFSFTIPGLFVAAVGMIYVLFVLPKLLPVRETTGVQIRKTARQFKAEITIREESDLLGLRPVSGFFPDLKGITVLTIEREDTQFYPPFDDIELREGDIVVIAATRDRLTELMKQRQDILLPENEMRDNHDDEPILQGMQSIAEVMVTPSSRLAGRTLEQIGFRRRYNCAVLAIERRSRMLRRRPTDIPLEAGDILLIQGKRSDIDALRGSQQVVLMEWSAEGLPRQGDAGIAAGIFFCVIALAGSGLLPTEIAALCGATAMVLTGCLPIDEAIRAIDYKIILLIAAALALGMAMQETGGAALLAHMVVDAVGGYGPTAVLSAFFLLTGLLANVLSTKATAVLFTPIAVNIARDLGVPAEAFAVAVVFAANCSFASPVGYQTNLLVMAPGGYRFVDFVKAGFPLLLVCWLAFSFFAPMWFDLTPR